MTTRQSPALDDEPIVVLVHGVGMSPSLYDRVIAELAPLRCVAPLRLGYGDPGARPAPSSFAEMVLDVAEMTRGTSPVVLVGVSGGATLALALSIHLSSHPELGGPIVHVIAHEPLVGPLTPNLHRSVSTRADQLAATPGPEAPLRFVEALVGPEVWGEIPSDAIEFAAAHHDVIRTEVPRFVSFAPPVEQLRSISIPLTVTVGADSPVSRFEVARLIARHAGARTDVVAGAGHLASWQQPHEFAAVVQRAVTAPAR